MQGIIKASPTARIVAAATGTALYTLTTGKKVQRITKIMWRNNAAAGAILDIGTGLAGLFAAVLPSIAIPGLLDGTLTERDIPAINFTANITCASSVAAAAPNDVEVMIEVEEV